MDGRTDGWTDGRGGWGVTCHLSTYNMSPVSSVQCSAALHHRRIVQVSPSVGWFAKKPKKVEKQKKVGPLRPKLATGPLTSFQPLEVGV